MASVVFSGGLGNHTPRIKKRWHFQITEVYWERHGFPKCNPGHHLPQVTKIGDMSSLDG